MVGPIVPDMEIKAMNLVIHPEAISDQEAIPHVNRLAFGQDDEVRLVDALRDTGLDRLSLVAEQADRVFGHILFSEKCTRVPESYGVAGEENRNVSRRRPSAGNYKAR
jgi:predicted N-acetyltransferase YhbS